MAVEFLVNRLKALIVLLLGVFRRAMCCLRRRRRSSCDSIPLSTIGVVPNTVNNTTQPVSFEHCHSPFFLSSFLLQRFKNYGNPVVPLTPIIVITEDACSRN